MLFLFSVFSHYAALTVANYVQLNRTHTRTEKQQEHAVC